MSVLTVRLPVRERASILAEVLVEDASMPEPEFRFIESAKRESIIPLSATHIETGETVSIEEIS